MAPKMKCPKGQSPGTLAIAFQVLNKGIDLEMACPRDISGQRVL
jgi:hypothetical protein